MVERRLITVFGGSGFIGRNLVKRLAAERWIVRVAVRDTESANFLKVLGDPGQIVPIATDVLRPETIAPAVAEAEAVVNLVGILYEKGARTFKRMHVEAAEAIASAARAAGAERLIHVSAIGADLDSPGQYGQTKGMGEQAVCAAFPGATIVRPSVVFGPEDDFLNRFATLARFLPALPVFDTSFQPVYVGDVADAIMRCLADDDTRGKTYELGGPRVVSFREVMQIVLKETGRKRCLFPMPFALAEIQGAVLELMPVPPLTRDQVKMLSEPNIVDKHALGFADLGIKPTAIETIVPTYLRQYRPPMLQCRGGV